MASETIRVLLCCQKPLLRTGLRALLDAVSDIDLAGEVQDPRQLPEAIERWRPDVLVMTVTRPTRHWLENLQDAGPRGRSAPQALVLVDLNEDEAAFDELVVPALQAGAGGLLPEGDDPEDLTRAIRVLTKGQAFLAPSVTRRLLDRFLPLLAPAAPRVHQPALEALTDRELEILRLVAQGLSNADVAALLSLNQGTIKSHLYHARRKLGVANRAQLVAFAYRNGLVTST